MWRNGSPGISILPIAPATSPTSSAPITASFLFDEAWVSLALEERRGREE